METQQRGDLSPAIGKHVTDDLQSRQRAASLSSGAESKIQQRSLKNATRSYSVDDAAVLEETSSKANKPKLTNSDSSRGSSSRLASKMRKFGHRIKRAVSDKEDEDGSSSNVEDQNPGNV